MRTQMTLRWLALCFFVASLTAGTAFAAEGHWEGAIEVPGNPIAIVIDLDKADDGTWSGTMDVPAQAVKDVALEDIKIDGMSVKFAVTVIPGQPAFDGSLSEEGLVFSGDYTQGGQTIPFRLERTSAEPEAPAAVDQNVMQWVGEGQPGEGAAGTWRGVLTVGSSALRLVMNISHTEADGYTGTLDSLDQNAMGIPLHSVVVNDDRLQIRVPAVAGNFEGTLSDDGAQVEGTWSQGGSSFPLTFKRSG